MVTPAALAGSGSFPAIAIPASGAAGGTTTMGILAGSGVTIENGTVGGGAARINGGGGNAGLALSSVVDGGSGAVIRRGPVTIA